MATVGKKIIKIEIYSLKVQCNFPTVIRDEIFTALVIYHFPQMMSTTQGIVREI